MRVLDRLSFGRALPGATGLVSDDDWSAFERDWIAPTFPRGYTVARAEGAWQDATSGAPVHEPTILLDVVHDDSPEAGAAVRKVAQGYKQAFRQDAVMRTTTPVSVDFI